MNKFDQANQSATCSHGWQREQASREGAQPRKLDQGTLIALLVHLRTTLLTQLFQELTARQVWRLLLLLLLAPLERVEPAVVRRRSASVRFISLTQSDTRNCDCKINNIQ